MYESVIKFLAEGDAKDAIAGANTVLGLFDLPLLKNKTDLLQVEDLKGGARINILYFVILAAFGAKVSASNSWLSAKFNIEELLTFTDERGVRHNLFQSDKPAETIINIPLEPFGSLEDDLRPYGPIDNLTQRTRILVAEKARRNRQLQLSTTQYQLPSNEFLFKREETGKELIYRYMQTFWSKIPIGVGWFNIPNPIPDIQSTFPFLKFSTAISIPYPTYYSAVRVYLGEMDDKSIIGLDLSKDGNVVQIANFIIANAHNNGIEINTRMLGEEIDRNPQFLIGDKTYAVYKSVSAAPPVFFGFRDSQQIITALKASKPLRDYFGVIDTSQNEIPKQFFLKGATRFGFGRLDLENPTLGLPAPPTVVLGKSSLVTSLFLFSIALYAIVFLLRLYYKLPSRPLPAIQDAPQKLPANFCSLTLTERANLLRFGRFSSVG